MKYIPWHNPWWEKFGVLDEIEEQWELQIVLAILNVIGVKEQDDIRDDRLSFLAAIRAVCITPETAQVPTRKMYEAVFQILKENKSLELTIMSYELSLDLKKVYSILKKLLVLFI